MTKEDGTQSSARLRSEVVRRIRTARALALFLDYDGTLSPIRRTPAAATLPRSASALLRGLARQPSVSLAIVTGRSLDDIRRRVRCPGTAYIADHGFCIAGGRGQAWVHPAARGSAKRLKDILSRMRDALAPFGGSFVEWKGATMSVHYRNVTPDSVPALRRTVRRVLRSTGTRARLLNGKKVLDIRPAVAWGKGRAVVRYLHHMRRGREALVIYVGDDVTDEDAFRALRTRGITVRVGSTGRTAAQFRVRSPSEVRTLLRRILNAWRDQRTTND